MKKYNVQLSCGCCDANVYFMNETNIINCFNKVGLTSSGIIIDDLNNIIEDVDTFYGFKEVISNDTINDNKLERLFNTIIKDSNL